MKAPTVTELIAVVETFNRAHELDIQDKRGHGKPNPMLDALYVAATNAAASLKPIMTVEIKTKKAA